MAILDDCHVYSVYITGTFEFAVDVTFEFAHRFVNQTIEDLECILLYIVRPKLLVPRGTTFSSLRDCSSFSPLFSSFHPFSTRILQEISRASEPQGLCGEQTW